MRYNFCTLDDNSIICSGDDSMIVSADKRYRIVQNSPDMSYGFLVEENRNVEKRLQIPELNSGFDTVYWYRGKNITKIKSDGYGCYVGNKEAGQIPLTFVTDIPTEGNYQIKITLFSRDNLEEAFVFLGRRRLAYLGKIQAGKEWTKTFLTNICPIVPRNYVESMEDTTLDVTIIGKGLHLKELEIQPVKCKTLYIAGDSTVTDQSTDYPYYPYHSYCGWGQMLSYYTGNQIAVSNHSHSGLTTESFRSEGHYKILLERITVGDICLFQFGHNDQKLVHLIAEGGYKDNLERYISQIQEKGATPVLVTPLARNTWKGNDGTYNDLLSEYAEVCKRLSKKYQIPLVDLHRKSKELVIRLGRENVKSYYFPSDYTHSNDYGAFLFAGFVYEDLTAQDIIDAKNQNHQLLWTPPEVLSEIVPPTDLAYIEDPNAERLFENLERPDDFLTRVEALELVITAMHFFPTNVYNDAFDDIVGHEVFAGTVECAYQNGLIPDRMLKDKKFQPLKNITGKEFLEIVMNGYKSRQGKQWVDSMTEEIENAKTITRKMAADICKHIHI